jgi:hypothetical protein
MVESRSIAESVPNVLPLLMSLTTVSRIAHYRGINITYSTQNVFMDYGRLDNYNKYKDRSVFFFSASSYKDARMLLDTNINEILTSYHYISKHEKDYLEDIFPTVKSRDGLFMTDSGAFSFFNGDVDDKFYDPKYWEPYLESYVNFLETNRTNIYCAANLDLDVFLGRERIDYWDKKYFKPLEKIVQIVYIAHAHTDQKYNDLYGMHRIANHLKKHDYIGIGSSLMTNRKGFDSKFFQLARQAKKRVHAFGWTSVPRLKNYSFFSVDSTTWLGGVRYGTSYIYDGKNFKTIDLKQKFRRKGDRIFCEDNGIDYDKLMKEDRVSVNHYNLLGWKGARNEVIKVANAKLLNNPVAYYDKSRA